MSGIYYTDLPISEKSVFYFDHPSEVVHADWLSGRRVITHNGAGGHQYFVYCDVTLSQVRADSGVSHAVPPGIPVDTTAQKLDELERRITMVMSNSEQAKALFESRIKAMDEQIKTMGQHIEDIDRRKTEAEVITENLKEQATEYAETISELEDELAEARKHEQIPKPPFDLFKDPNDMGDNSMIPPPPAYKPNVHPNSTLPGITYYSNRANTVQDEQNRIAREMANRMLKKNR